MELWSKAEGWQRCVSGREVPFLLRPRSLQSPPCVASLRKAGGEGLGRRRGQGCELRGGDTDRLPVSRERHTHRRPGGGSGAWHHDTVNVLSSPLLILTPPPLPPPPFTPHDSPPSVPPSLS